MSWSTLGIEVEYWALLLLFRLRYQGDYTFRPDGIIPHSSSRDEVGVKGISRMW